MIKPEDGQLENGFNQVKKIMAGWVRAV